MVSGLVDSRCHKLSENVWFVWSKTSCSGESGDVIDAAKRQKGNGLFFVGRLL